MESGVWEQGTGSWLSLVLGRGKGRISGVGTQRIFA